MHDGFTYYWFATEALPSWENYSDCTQLQYTHELTQQAVDGDPEGWVRDKCEFEARVTALLLLWAGGGNGPLSDAVHGLVFKIRRTRTVLQLWCRDPERVRQPAAAAMGVHPEELHKKAISDVMQSESNRNSRRSSRASSAYSDSSRPRGRR